jgi:hypothetical protein
MKFLFPGWLRYGQRMAAVCSYAVIAILAVVAAGHAQTPNAALNAILSDIRSDGGAVEIGSAENGRGAGDVRLTDFKISFPRDKQGNGAEISFGKLELTGARMDETKLVIDQARGERARFAGPAGQVALARFSIDKLSAPSAGAAKAGERPFRSLVDQLAKIVSTEFKQVSAEDLRWERPFGAAAVITAARFTASDARNGAIAHATLTQPKRVEDGAEKSVGAETIAVDGLDLAQIVKIFEGQGQGQTPNLSADTAREWRSLAASTTIQGYVQTDKVARTDIAQIQLSGLRVRRFAIDAGPFLDLATATPSYFREHPDQARKLGEALMDVVKLDRANIAKLSGTDGQSPVARRFGIESIEIVDLDPLNANSITLSAIEDHRGDSGASIGRVALSKLRLVEAGAAAPANAGPTRKFPIFGGIAIANVKFVQPGALIELKAFDWDAPSYRGAIPTRVHASVSGLSVPVGLMPDPGIRADLVYAGVTALPIDADVSANFDEIREQASLDRFSLSVGSLGQIELTGALAGVPAAAFDSGDGMKAAALAASVKGVKVKYMDAGLAGHVINAIAMANKQPAEQIRKALAANMPMLLGAIPDASTRNTLIFALVGFLNDPQGIEFASLAQDPVPVAALDKALREAPASIPVLLKVNANVIRKH